MCFGEWDTGKPQEIRGHEGNPITELAGLPRELLISPHQ